MNQTQQRALRLLLEAELSHSEIHDALRKALRALHSKAWVWLQEIYDSHVVYEVNPKPDPAMPDEAEPPKARLFDATYSVDDQGVVTLGTPAEVRRVVSYEPVAQAAPAAEAASDEFDLDFMPLIEKAVRKDGVMPIKIIQPGWGSSGFYKAEVLERDGPKVFTKGLRMFADHPTPTEEAERPERSVKDLVATLTTDAAYNATGPAGPGLYAEAKVVDSWKPVVEELAPHIGLSIRALGKAVRGEAEGRKGPIIEGIVAAKSVDLVTAAGAGGKILNLFESARARAAQPVTPGGEDSMNELQEAQAARTAAETQLAEARAENTTLKEELARYRQAELMSQAVTFIEESVPKTLEGVALDVWAISRERLTESLKTKVTVKDGALDKEAFKPIIEAALKAECEFLAKITESGKIRGMGGSTQTTADADRAALKESWKKKYLAEGKTPEEADHLSGLAVQ